MAWEVEYTNEFEDWWFGLIRSQRSSISNKVEMLVEFGPNLPYPHSSGVIGSRHGRMRELRIQSRGRPIRVFYAFDPRRSAILLIGGDKTGNTRFYREYIPIADRLYDEHLEELRDEGLM